MRRRRAVRSLFLSGSQDAGRPSVPHRGVLFPLCSVCRELLLGELCVSQQMLEAPCPLGCSEVVTSGHAALGCGLRTAGGHEPCSLPEPQLTPRSWQSVVLSFLFNIYLAVPGLSYSRWDLWSLMWQVGSSSLTKDRTWAPSTGNMEFEPLDHQGSPQSVILQRLSALMQKNTTGLCLEPVWW